MCCSHFSFCKQKRLTFCEICDTNISDRKDFLNKGENVMFSWKDRLDNDGKTMHRDYCLTQGDSFGLTASVKVESDRDVVVGLKFRLGKINPRECKIDFVFEKEYTMIEGVWTVLVSSEETAKWEANGCDEVPYAYEIEVVYVDGGVNTLEQAYFTVEPQIGG